jgi:valyl-tRNA synthetase
MSTELSKAYDPSAVEPEANRVWTEERLFHAEPEAPGRPFAIVIPPPNVTAALHLGHALNNTLQDILVRWRRMMGDNAVWLPGTDHAGIATQTVVEKRVLAEEGKRRTEFGREEFVAKIQAWKDEYEARITEQLKRMGCSCDWERQAFTMDEPRARAVREAFFRLFRDGLIYRAKYLVNWDPATQTALADDEVEMEEVDGHFYYLRYPLVEGDRHEGTEARRHEGEGMAYVTVATTRPETMLGDTAVAINPKDPRAAKLRGKKVRLPIVNRVVPIIEDDYVVLPDAESDDPKAKYATGFLKVTPAHDPNDYEIGQRHGLAMINVMAPDASISDQHGWPKEDFEQGGEDLENLLGMDRYEARQAVVEWFRRNGLLEDVKPYRHTVGHSYRSHVAIEPYLSDQWWVATKRQIPSMADEGLIEGTDVPRNSLAGLALRALSGTGCQPVPHGLAAHATIDGDGALRLVPERYSKTYQAWHENIRDWCISRQLWWGHRIPVWTGRRSQAPDLFQTVNKLSHGVSTTIINGQELPFVEAEANSDLVHMAVFWPGDWVEHLLGQRGLEQDPDVLDTWFSSGLWPLSTLGWPEETAALGRWNPTNVLCTAREIITLWVSRMVMLNRYFRAEARRHEGTKARSEGGEGPSCLPGPVPFYDVFVHAMIQDGEGRKMSKSLGNGVDPVDIIESHGADAMRFTLASMTTHTQDVRMPVEKDEETGKNTSPKFDNGRNFCNKLWNAARFVLMNLSERDGETERRRDGVQHEGDISSLPDVSSSLSDRWILSRLGRTILEVDEALSGYRFDQYAKTCYDFFWRDYCDWYIEATKPAMKDASRREGTAAVLAAALDAALRLMHPMIPFITEKVYWNLCEVMPEGRGIPGKLMGCTSPRLIVAAWPRADASLVDEVAERDFSLLQEVITAIRNIRNEYKVEPRRAVEVSIKGPEPVSGLLTANRELVELLGTCRLKEVGVEVAPPEKAARAIVAGCEVFVQGLMDEAAEEQRVSKRREELLKQIGALKGRLGNEAYVKKAPAHLVEQTRDQLAEAEAELATLG